MNDVGWDYRDGDMNLGLTCALETILDYVYSMDFSIIASSKDWVTMVI